MSNPSNNWPWIGPPWASLSEARYDREPKIDAERWELSLRQEADLLGDLAPSLVFAAQEIGHLLGRLSGVHDRTDRGNPLDQLRFGKRGIDVPVDPRNGRLGRTGRGDHG